jgi:hypothetical protein
MRNLAINPLRLEQIEEAFADLEAVFADPTCFHSEGTWDDRPVQDYALSLSSEFVGTYRDDEITSRLAKLIKAEDAGRPKDAFHHLGFVRRKVDARLREWRSQIVTTAQLDEGSIAPEAIQTLDPVISTRAACQRPFDALEVRVLEGASV